jgi:hypothetical protein
VAEPLRPSRGGFLRPFGCGWFIREFLLGHEPYGSPKVNPEIGAPQADIFYFYKMALFRDMALDKAVRLEERRARKEGRLIDPDKITRLANRFLYLMPYKTRGCRYHSFVIYFSNLQRLGWVEFTGREETSAFQGHYLLGPGRKYFRLTKAGREASDAAWANPHAALYGRR